MDELLLICSTQLSAHSESQTVAVNVVQESTDEM